MSAHTKCRLSTLRLLLFLDWSSFNHGGTLKECCWDVLNHFALPVTLCHRWHREAFVWLRAPLLRLAEVPPPWLEVTLEESWAWYCRSSQASRAMIVTPSSRLCSLLPPFHHSAGSHVAFLPLALPSELSKCVTAGLLPEPTASAQQHLKPRPPLLRRWHTDN